MLPRKDDATMQEVIGDVANNQRVVGEHNIWYYLLRYERHHNYPKDNRGYMLDVLHVALNFIKKSYVDQSVVQDARGTLILKQSEKISYHEIMDLVDFDPAFRSFASIIEKEYKGFIKVAMLFLILKDVFSMGLVDGPEYFKGMYLDEAIELLFKHYDKAALTHALYLIGFCLGRELTYKFAYLHNKLPILKVD